MSDSRDAQPIALPEKPALEGLEPKWNDRWAADGTYAFDRTRRATRSIRSTRRRRRSAARCTSATCSRTRTPTSSRASSGCAARPCSIRWGGTTTGCRPSGACRTTTASAAIRRCRTTRRFSRQTNRQAGDLGFAAELHRAVQPADGRGRKGVRAPVALSRPVGRLVEDLRHDRPAVAAGVADGVPAAAEAWRCLSARGADALGHRLPDGRCAGRARGSRAARRVSSHPLRSCRRRRG